MPKIRAGPNSSSSEEFYIRNGRILLEKLISHAHGKLEDNHLRIFTSQELVKATNNYHHSQLIARGFFGTFYEGSLENRVVAVKKANRDLDYAMEQCINEVVVLSNINHRNVVRFLGCCLETSLPILVYEFIPNGTLKDHIENANPRLSWPARLSIATQVAEALNYLHCHAPTPVIHRNVNPGSIMLDQDYIPKLTTFNLSVSIPLGKTKFEGVVDGTAYFLDHQALNGEFTEKNDVYAFGVSLTLLLTGKNIQSLVHNSSPLIPENDSLPQSSESYVSPLLSYFRNRAIEEYTDAVILREAKMEQLQAFLQLALRCVQFRAEERPTMKEVVKELKQISKLLP